MESLFIPTEEDFKRWINNAVSEVIGEKAKQQTIAHTIEEPLLSRKEIIALLNISMATLTNWQRNGLPFHKKCNRVYFVRSEVMTHIKSTRVRK